MKRTATIKETDKYDRCRHCKITGERLFMVPTFNAITGTVWSPFCKPCAKRRVDDDAVFLRLEDR